MKNEKDELNRAIIAFSCSLLLSVICTVLLVHREVAASSGQNLWYHIKTVLIHPHHMGILILALAIGLFLMVLKKIVIGRQETE